MTLTTSHAKQLSDGNGDGTTLGQSSSDPVGFYGATPADQYAAITPLSTTRLGEVRFYSVPATTGVASHSTNPEQTTGTVASSLAADSCIVVTRSSTTTGLAVCGGRVSAANTFAANILNVSTGATLVPVSTQAYYITEFKANGGFVTTAVWSPAAVAASTTAEQTVTVPGALPGMMVAVNKPTAQTALAVANARISAVSTVAVAFANISSAAITPTAAETYTFALVPNLHAASPIVQYRVPATTVAAAIGVTTTVEQSTTLMNMLPTDFYVGCTIPASQQSVQAVTGRIDVTSGVLAMTWANASSGANTPTSSHAIGVTILRPEARPAVQIYSTTLAGTTCPASTTIEQSTTVTGLLVSSAVWVNKLFHTAGIGIANARVSAADTLTVAYFNTNTTATAIPAGEYLVAGTPAIPSWGVGASAYQSSAALASTCAYMSYQVNPGVAQYVADLRGALSENGLMKT